MFDGTFGATVELHRCSRRIERSIMSLVKVVLRGLLNVRFWVDGFHGAGVVYRDLRLREASLTVAC